jgi:hypothetical protein
MGKKFRETPYHEILEACANQPGLTPAEIEELAAAHCQLRNAGPTFTRNDLFSGANEKPEPAPYAHFAEPPYFYVPDDESLRDALSRLEREEAMAEQAAKALKGPA